MERAREVSLVFQPGASPTASEPIGEVLAKHLDGYQLRAGERLALPGWGTLIVERIDPPASVVAAGTQVEVDVPPRHGKGPMQLAFLVDASLTMGEGSPRAYDRAATLIDAVLMNGRSFLASAGIVVQGGETRHVIEPDTPESLTGAAIHRVDPKGTFDPGAGLERALAMLADAPEGPRAVLVVTDGDHDVADPLGLALPAAREGVHLVALAGSADPQLAEACRLAGGRAGDDPEQVFAALAETAGARPTWSPPPEAGDHEADPEFETVIDTMEERP